MTNLEWLKTLSAEELADWFYDEWLHHLQYRWSSSRGGLIIWLKDRKTEPNNYCDDCLYTDTCDSKEFFYACTSKATISKMEQVDEPKICDTCRYYNSNIPCGSTPSACKEADKFAEEFVDGLKKLKPKDEPQTNADQHVQHVGSVEPTWPKEEHEAFYTFLWNVINPNEMQDYIGMFETKDEPQTDCPWR